MLATVVAMCVTAAVAAQSQETMGKPSKGKTMSTMYTGCVESVNHGSWFLLTKVDAADGDSMHGDMAMKNHKDMATKGDAAGTMQNAGTPKAGDKMDGDKMADDKMSAMSPKAFALAGSAKFSRYVGQRVSVTGSLSDGSMVPMRPGVSTLTVRTLKVIAKSCS